MLGGLGNIGNLMKLAKDFQGNMARVQEELAKKRFEADAGAGMVRVVVDGKFNLIDVKIDPQAAQDVEMLEDLVKAAVGAALSKAQDGVKAEMAAVTGGMNIPGLSEMLGGGA